MYRVDVLGYFAHDYWHDSKSFQTHLSLQGQGPRFTLFLHPEVNTCCGTEMLLLRNVTSKTILGAAPGLG